MHKFINLYKNNQHIVNQVISGLIHPYDDRLICLNESNIIRKKEINPNKVVLMSGGGSGHEPAHIGYIGENMLDCAVMGDIYQPPSSDEVYRAIIDTYNGQGTLLIIKNFDADLKSFIEAENRAKDQGYIVDHVVVKDDCSVEQNSFQQRERGVAGTIFVHKILGAAANQQFSLEELVHLGDQVIRNLKTLGVAFAPGDAIGSVNQQYSLEDDEMYFGIGIHGEPGYRKERMQTSERIAIELSNKLFQQFTNEPQLSFAVMVNGLGSLSMIELAIFLDNVVEYLDIEEKPIRFTTLGNFMTSYNTNGLSLTFLNLVDDEWFHFLRSDTDAFAWPNK